MNIAKSSSSLFISLALAIVACSSEDSSSSASACDEAAKVADSCSTSQTTDAGKSSVSIKFDVAECKKTEQGQKAAECIVANKSNCDCLVQCALSGSCS